MELNLEKYEFIILFQVGILDTSKYSTWKHRERKGRELFLTNQREAFRESGGRIRNDLGNYSKLIWLDNPQGQIYRISIYSTDQSE